jgi:hypothetical protein
MNESHTCPYNNAYGRYYDDIPLFLALVIESDARKAVLLQHFQETEGRNVIAYISELLDLVSGSAVV